LYLDSYSNNSSLPARGTPTKAETFAAQGARGFSEKAETFAAQGGRGFPPIVHDLQSGLTQNKVSKKNFRLLTLI
jgi:hypothetical protein